MSMIGNLARVSDDTRARLHETPALVTGLLYPHTTVLTKADAPGLLDRLFGIKPEKKVAPTDPAMPGIKEGDHLDIDKSWHGLHYLFTGSAWEGSFPQGFLLTAGTAIGEVDVGYGAARSFTSSEVREIAAFLESLDETALKKKMNLEEMVALEIYPSFGGSGEHADEEWEYLASSFHTLKQFVQATAAARQAMLVYLN